MIVHRFSLFKNIIHFGEGFGFETPHWVVETGNRKLPTDQEQRINFDQRKHKIMNTLKTIVILAAALTLAAAFPAQAGIIATSTTEFSGVQGQNGWTYGYREVPAAGASENYDPDRDFIPFAGGDGQGEWNGSTQQWTGTGWKAGDGSELTGTSSRPGGSSRWTVRRWQSELTQKGPVSLKWTLAKDDVTCGNGVTGALYLNGQLADKTTIAFDRATTVTRTFYALLCPADRVDLVLRPLGTDGTDDAQCDTTRLTLIVNTTIAPEPKQPNGRLFVTSLTGPKFDILSQTRSAAGDQVSLRWRSLPEATYGVDASGDLANWTSIKTGLAGSPCQSSLSETLAHPTQGHRFYRVVQETKSIEGLWVALYDNTWYELVRVQLNGDQAVATKLIGDIIVPGGQITWKANVKTGVGQVQVAHDGFIDPSWIPATLRVVSPDRLTVTLPSYNLVVSFRRVD